MNPQLTWNLITDVQQMWAYPFMVTALRAGTVVAVLAGVVGWVMVLRKESFAGHTLAIVGFPGAAAAAWLGVATGYGYFAACIGAAAVIALLPGPTQAGGLGGFSEEPAGIGTIQALALATGFLFVSLYHGFLSGLTDLLFGTIAGVSSQQLDVLLIAALVCLIVLAAIGRPLLWASIDPDAAAVNGVPVRTRRRCVPPGARRRRGGCQPDHRQPLGVRAAGGPARGRLPLHRPSRAGHCALGPHRGRRDLGGHRLRVLFAVSDRVLGEQLRVRHLSGRRRLPGERRADPAADRPTAALPGSPRGGGMTITDGRACASGPLTGVANMLGHPFITHALVAGTAVALVCGLVGYFLVLRGQVFAADAQGHIAYTGAMAALVAGLDPRVGLFAATIIAGVALGVINRRGADDVAIGSFFSWMLGLGALFLTYYTTHGSGNNGTANVNVLFGSIFGISDQARALAVAVAAGVGRRDDRDRAPAAVRHHRPGCRPGGRRADPGAEYAFPGHCRGYRCRGHPDHRRACRARPARRAGRRRRAADDPALARVLAVRRLGHGRDLDWRHRRLRRSGGARHLHHHEHRRHDLPDRRRDKRPRPPATARIDAAVKQES